MDYFSVYSTISHWALSMDRALSAALLAWFQPSKVHTLMRKMEENSDKESPCGGGGGYYDIESRLVGSMGD